MTDEIKLKTQQEWIKTVTLTPEQIREIIANKLERGKIYSVNVRKKAAPRSY